MNDVLLAYLAGAIDSDGYISIKKSTYHQRVRGDAHNAVYSERVGLKQVTPDIPDLLCATFHGRRDIQRPSSTNGKPLHGWLVSDLNAAKACAALLPYLRVKRRQAETVLELRESKSGRYRQESYWFERDHPDWRDMELLTASEALRLLGHTDRGSLSQAIANGSLLALPYRFDGRWKGEVARFPRVLVEHIAAQRGKDGRALLMPPQLVAWRERLYQTARELNRIGTGQHPVTERTGPYAPVEV